MMILQRLRAHMSPQTYQMHRTALISLTMQMVIPGMLLTTPLYMILVVIMTNSLAFEGNRKGFQKKSFYRKKNFQSWPPPSPS